MSTIIEREQLEASINLAAKTITIGEASELYALFSDYFTVQLKTRPLVVISSQLDMGLSPTPYRYVFNRIDLERYRGAIDKLAKIIGQMDGQSKSSAWHTVYDDGEQKLLILLLGAEGQQNFWGLLNVDSVKCSEMEFLNHLARLFIAAWKNVGRFNRLKCFENLSYVDDVTGLYNQRKIHLDLNRKLAVCDGQGSSLAVLFIDIDHFKRVNDTYGHSVGTKVLRQVANLLRTIFRETDLIYRYGGDEFIVMLNGIGESAIKTIGERIIADLRRHKFTVADKHFISLSVSVGIAQYPQDADRQNILEAADVLLYAAKKAGRGCFRFNNTSFL